MMMQAKTEAPPLAVFVLEIDGQPILAFRAATLRQAREVGKEERLQEDLKRITVGYRPLWDGKAPINVRYAQPGEAVYYIDAQAENARRLAFGLLRSTRRRDAGKGPHYSWIISAWEIIVNSSERDQSLDGERLIAGRLAVKPPMRVRSRGEMMGFLD